MSDVLPASHVLEELISAQAAQFPSPWQTPPHTLAGWRESLSTEIDRLSNADFAAGFQEYWPVVPDTAMYNNHLRRLTDGTLALTGIRCRGGNHARPFVDAVALSRPPRDEADLTRLAHEIAAPYAAFAPKHVRFLVPDGAFDVAALPAGSHWDLLVIGAPVAEMNRQERVASFGRVELRRPADLGFYPRYAAEYAALHAANPLHREYANPASEENLAGSLKAGHVYEIWVEGQWAGVAAAYRDEGYGLRGFVVQEMLLGAAWRGQRLGSAVQQHLAQALTADAEAGDMLYGTIHSDNLSAIRSAQRAGRRRLAAQLWVGII